MDQISQIFTQLQASLLTLAQQAVNRVSAG